MTCGIQKYPWRMANSIILENKGPPKSQIYNNFTREVYDHSLKRLAQGKAPWTENIPNKIIKALSCHDMFFLFFLTMLLVKGNPTLWKHSKTILLHKKEDPLLLTNYKPITLANTIYKFYTNTLTSLSTSYNKKHRLLYFNQERLEHKETPQDKFK